MMMNHDFWLLRQGEQAYADYKKFVGRNDAPVIEKMRREGAVVLLKWDGERGVGDNGPYTIVVTGRVLQGDFFRTDTHSLEEALSAGIVFYARKMWNILD